jgi:hypothetical protein
MPPVRDLDGLRCPGGGALGEERGTVAADDLDTGPLCQPRGQSRRLPVGQQVNWAPRLDIDEDRAVVAALAGGVLVDADHPRRGHVRLGKRVDQAKDGAAADGHPQDGGQAGAGPARQGKPHCCQGRTQTLGPLTVPAGQTRYLLDEGASHARGVLADEPDGPSAGEQRFALR